MRLLRLTRMFFLALLLSVVSAPVFASVFISVGFAPPVLPVYEQPVFPQPGWMWTPGYWAYGPDGYFWVPGTWVPAPYVGALWTPGYWGWSDGLYVFHDGYWGPHVGYYGGVNYGFGYMGIGFAGGEWRGHDFAYNTAVMHVDEHVIHTTYIDRTIVERTTVVRDSHVAYSGGPGGIHHDPAPAELQAAHDQHVTRTSFQVQHETAARSDRTAYVKNNGGHPQNLAVARPLTASGHPASTLAHPDQPAMRNGGQGVGARPNNQPQTLNQQQNRPAVQPHPATQPRPETQARPQPQTRQDVQPRPETQQRMTPQARPETQQRVAPQPRPEAQQRVAPQPRAQPQPATRPEASRPAQQRPEERPKEKEPREKR